MNDPKAPILTTLRDKTISRATFRQAAHRINELLAYEALQQCAQQRITVQTPLGTAQGTQFKNNLVLVPILRSGLTMLAPFLEYFDNATVGVVGLKRDEKTAIAHLYYHHLPQITAEDQIIILDPMIATGGTGVTTIKMLIECGAQEANIMFVAIVGAPEGITHIQTTFPQITLVIAGHDEHLSKEKLVYPGLGDFGDRYFGTE